MDASEPCGATIIDKSTAMPTARSVRFIGLRQRFNHTAPCAVKRAGFADEIAAGRRSSGKHRRGWRDPVEAGNLVTEW